jgi:SH3-like domain-containing protein
MRLKLSLLFGWLLVAGAANALEMRSIGSAAAVMYDAPTMKGSKLYVAPRGMPVEVILTYGTFTKVRDVSGDLSWVETKDLVARRMLIVKATNARIRASADDSATLIFSADKHVLLEMAETPVGAWVKVKHKEGQIGYVRLNEVWGL